MHGWTGAGDIRITVLKTIKGEVFERKLVDISIDGEVTFHCRNARLPLQPLDETDRLELAEDVYLSWTFYVQDVSTTLSKSPSRFTTIG